MFIATQIIKIPIFQENLIKWATVSERTLISEVVKYQYKHFT
jgi:hypothetical protein